MKNSCPAEETAFLQCVPVIEETIGYRFWDVSLLQQAFTRSSFCNEENRTEIYSSNETLEFFGDTILSAAIVTALIRDTAVRYEHGVKLPHTEGQLHVIKSKLSDKTNLSRQMRRLGLQKYLLMNAGDREQNVAETRSVMEDLFESIVGAVYIDSGMRLEAVIPVVERMLDVGDYLNGQVPQSASFKNALQEFCQDKKRRLPIPQYLPLQITGPEHAPHFLVSCRVGDTFSVEGEGKNSSLAEEDAAQKMLSLLKEAEVAGTLSTPQTVAPTDAVVRLTKYTSEKHLPQPCFQDLGQDEATTPQKPLFRCACLVGNEQICVTAPSKKDARRLAASQMLNRLKKQYL